VSSTTVACQPWVALLAFVVIVYFSVRNVMWIRSIELPSDEKGGGYLGARARIWFRECTASFEDALTATPVGPDALTYSQIFVALAAGMAFACGAMFIGGWLVIAAGTMDVLDGAIARRRGGGTTRGAFIDSVVDRYAELIVYAGLAVYFRNSWVIWVIGLALFGSVMVSYARARAEGLGANCQVGGAQRPERIVLLGFGAFLSDIAAHIWCAWTGVFSHALLAIALVAMAAIANLTALGRIRWAAHHLSGTG